MLTEVCDFVHNYFEHTDYHGTFEISNGTIDLDSLVADGQRFRIIGSRMNNGIYTKTENAILDDDGKEEVVLTDETFSGTVSAMAVPRLFLQIVDDIIAWTDANKDVLNSPYTSETFGGYSYTKATGSGTNAGGSLSWQDVFRGKLNAYRKIA